MHDIPGSKVIEHGKGKAVCVWRGCETSDLRAWEPQEVTGSGDGVQRTDTSRDTVSQLGSGLDKEKETER